MARVRLEKSMNWVHHGVAPSPPTFLGGCFTHRVDGPATEVAIYSVEPWGQGDKDHIQYRLF